MSALSGIHLPNRHLSGDDLPRILGLNTRHFLIYVYDLQDVAYWVGVANQIRAQRPSSSIHVRVERRGQPLTPAQDAVILKGVMDAFGSSANTFRIRNEPNHSEEGGNGLTHTAWSVYLSTFLIELRRLRADVRRVYCPAVSPGHNWQAWVQAVLPILPQFGGLDVHAYGSLGEIEGVIAQVRLAWSGPIVVTETNYGPGPGRSPAGYDAQIPTIYLLTSKYSCPLIWFIWDWIRPIPGQEGTIIRGTPMEGAIRALKDGSPVSPVTPVTPVPPVGGGTMDSQPGLGEGFRMLQRDHPSTVGRFRRLPSGQYQDYFYPGTQDEVAFGWTDKGFALWIRRENRKLFIPTNQPYILDDSGNRGTGRIVVRR